jgi:uncharacterized membrane protein (UPF0136 family)
MTFLLVAIAPWLLLLYAIVVLVGAVVSAVKAQSKPSRLSSLISGIALLITGITTFQTYSIGMTLATVLALALSIRFALRFRQTHKVMPAGLMAAFSLVCAVIFALALAL